MYYNFSIINLFIQNLQTRDDALPEGHINLAFAKVKQRDGFRFYWEEVYPTYYLTQLHLNHIFARGHEKR